MNSGTGPGAGSTVPQSKCRSTLSRQRRVLSSDHSNDCDSPPPAVASTISSRQDHIHTFRGIALQRRDHVAVGVHCQTDLTVAERLHNDARMNTLSQEQRCACMAEVVEPKVRQAGALQEL